MNARGTGGFSRKFKVVFQDLCFHKLLLYSLTKVPKTILLSEFFWVREEDLKNKQKQQQTMHTRTHTKPQKTHKK